MLRRVKILHRINIEVDVDVTRLIQQGWTGYNARHQGHDGFTGCKCVNCRNLGRAFESSFPESLKLPLREIGLDWRHPWVSTCCVNDESRRVSIHNVDFVFSGRLLDDITPQEQDDEHALSITNDQIGPSLPDEIQIPNHDISWINVWIGDVPWVLDEPFPHFE